MPQDYVPAGTSYTQIFKFITKAETLNTGTNGWNAFEETFAAGPQGGVLTDNFTLGSRNQGDIDKVFTEGGEYLAGLAFTDFNGVAVRGAVYRTINVEAGNTGKWTVDPIVEGETPVWAPNFAQFSATPGASAEIRNGNLVIEAGAAGANKTVDVWAEGAAKVATVTLDAAGSAINTKPAAVNNGTHLAVAEGENVVAWIATTEFARTQPTDAANAATKVTIPAPAEGEATITIAAGAANANQTFAAYGWSTPTDLGTVTTDAAGNVTVNASALGNGAHTVALFDADDEVVAWGEVTLVLDALEAETDLSVDVLTSDKFALEGVSTAVNLGAVKRGQTTAPVALGAFTVVDDRDALPGWNLTAAVADFTNATANNDVIGKAALGLAPKQVGTALGGISLGAAQAAGSGTYSALFAQGNAESSTGEAGTQFDADLTFAAPSSAKKGNYTSTLTLTLASK